MKELRSEIDLIHDQIYELLERRIHITTQIWKEKINQQSSLLDLDREQQLIHRHDNRDLMMTHPELKIEYQKIIKNLIEMNKRHLENNLIKKKSAE